jgi:hypothetical protein
VNGTPNRHFAGLFARYVEHQNVPIGVDQV